MSTNDPLVGQQFGDYVLQRLLGSGGMARVYLGYDQTLDRYSAVKVSEPQLVAGEYDDEFRERFLREARAIARMKHPRIVGVYQFGQIDTLYYMAMELVEGRNLHQILKDYAKQEQLIPREDILTILSDVAEALDYAHKEGIIHRDIKPSNIMVKDDGHAVLMDFGLALNVPEGTVGNTFGSVHYIAPEQAISSAQAVPQSDLYSMAVVLYEMLTGRVPFDDISAMSVALKHISDPPPPPSHINPNIAPVLEDFVIRALDKDPNKRYQSGAEFMRELRSAFVVAGDAHSSAPQTVESATDTRPPQPTTPAPPGTAPVPADDDAPTILDTASRPKTLKSGARQSQKAGRSMLPIIALAVVAVIAVIVVVLLASGGQGGGISDADVTASADAQTAIALAAITEEPTVTDTDTPEPTATDTVEPTATLTHTPQPSATDTDTPEPTATNTATDTPTATNTATPTRTPTPTETFTPSPSPTESLEFAEGDAQVLLMYIGRTLVLINRDSSANVDISLLSFVQTPAEGDPIVFTASEWTAGDLRALHSEHCYQVWSTEFRSLPANEAPADVCASRQGFVSSSRLFWVSDEEGATFEVRRGSDVLATCPATTPGTFVETRCAVNVRR